MPSHNRNNEPYRPSFGGFSFFPPVIKNLLLINIAVFVMQVIFERGFHVGSMRMEDWMIKTFALAPLGDDFRVWQLVTYMFLHANISHIFFNMLALWMFGMEIENTWGSKKFVVFYFLCGIGAGLANLFVAPSFSDPLPTLGASGGVYGVLVAFAMLYPNRMIFIFPLPIPIKAKYFISFYVLLEFWQGFTSAGGGVAHIAHLGGALIGAIWVLLDNKGMIDQFGNSIRSQGWMGGKEKKKWSEHAKEATFYDINSNSSHSSYPHVDPHQEIIDRILDKISKSGYENLTEEEKRILFEESKKFH